MPCERDDKGFINFDDDVTLEEALEITLWHQMPSRLPKSYLLEAAFWCGVSAVIDMRSHHPDDFMDRVVKEHSEAFKAFQAKVKAWVDPEAEAIKQAMRLVARWETEDAAIYVDLRHDGKTYWIYTKDNRSTVPGRLNDDDAIKIHEVITEGLNLMTANPHRKLRRVQ